MKSKIKEKADRFFYKLIDFCCESVFDKNGLPFNQYIPNTIWGRILKLISSPVQFVICVPLTVLVFFLCFIGYGFAALPIWIITGENILN
jgi:hypothetical protein